MPEPEVPTRAASRVRMSEFYRRVFEKYREIAAREPVRVVVIDSDRSIEEVHQNIVRLVEERLALRLGLAAG